MRTAGIICECNPFHAGHRHLIEEAKWSGADAVICVMSGCFTQRGEPAILEPQVRARILLEGGADAVLELPYPHSAAGAEFFAAAGVDILSRLGVDELWFGSECGDLQRLTDAAAVLASDAFAELYRERCKRESGGTAELFFDCLRELGGGERYAPNDTLAMAYLRALRVSSSPMLPQTIRREGSDFHDRVLKKDTFPSATALRSALKEQGIASWSGHLTPFALQLAEKELRAGRAPAELAQNERAVLGYFQLTSREEPEQVPELGGGLGGRIFALARSSDSLDGLIKRAVTKKYTEARVRRGILFALTGVRESDLRAAPAYAVLLAANAVGCRFLAERKKQRAIPVVTSHAGIPDNAAAARQEELTRRAFSLYGLCLPSITPAAYFLSRSAVVEREPDIPPKNAENAHM